MISLYNGFSHGSGHAANAADMATKRGAKAKADKAQTQTSVLSDDQIRQMRALFDFRGWSKSQLAKHYDIKYSAVDRIIDCLTRAKVSHSEADVPKGL